MTEDAEVEALVEHWRKHVESWRSSNDSQAMYCKAHTLIYHRFVYWRRKFEAEARSVTRESSGFSRVIVPGVEAGLCVVLPGGAVVRGISTDNLALLRQLLAWPS